MNILRKSLAPISDKAWDEITEQLDDILKTYLTGRKFVDIDGPNGLEFGSVSTGRLVTPDNQDDQGVNYGIREVLPLVEIRKPFEMDLWELDNIDRGAKDPNLEPLEKAAKEVALFEEKTIYEGFEPASIKGLKTSSEKAPVTVPSDVNDFIKEISNQTVYLKENAVEGPYTLVVSAKDWLNIVELSEGYPVQKQIQEILGGQVIINHSNENTFLVSERGGDYELVIGQDITIGYDSHSTEKVKLYLTSSFTFRVLTPESVVVFNRKT